MNAIIDNPNGKQKESGGKADTYAIPKLSKTRGEAVCKVAHRNPEIVAYIGAGGSVTHIDTLLIFVNSLIGVVDDRIFSAIRTATLSDNESICFWALGELLFATYPQLEKDFNTIYGEDVFSMLDLDCKRYFHSFFGAAFIELKRERMKILLDELREEAKQRELVENRRKAEEQEARKRNLKLIEKDPIVTYCASQMRDRSGFSRIIGRLYDIDKNTEVNLRDLKMESKAEDFSSIFDQLNEKSSDLRFKWFAIATVRALRVQRIGGRYEYKPRKNELTTRLLHYDGKTYELPLMAGF